MKYNLFDVYGIELEYMIVDKKSLDVNPITDRLIHDITGTYVNDVECGDITYSNELALHVVELKTTEPVSDLNGLEKRFQSHIEKINARLELYNSCLMPGGAHPWMDPFHETKLWAHENNPIYEAYNTIFDCRGHGWSNLQSTHINLPFQGDAEFSALHTAIRLLLPILPALSASSPFLDTKATGKMDTRIDVYRHNQKRIPLVAGEVIPEAVHSYDEYVEKILQPMYRAISPYDAAGILQEEWLNSRGAIARFERSAIEIRVLDIQECPAADIAIAEAIVGVLKGLIHSRWSDFEKLRFFPQEKLVQILNSTIQDAELAVIQDPEYLNVFGLEKALTAQDLWRHLVPNFEESAPLQVILTQGPLARRLLRSYQKMPSKERLQAIFRVLTHSLQDGAMYEYGTSLRRD